MAEKGCAGQGGVETVPRLLEGNFQVHSHCLLWKAIVPVTTLLEGDGLSDCSPQRSPSGRVEALFLPVQTLTGGCLVHFEGIQRPVRLRPFTHTSEGIASPAALDVTKAVDTFSLLDYNTHRLLCENDSRTPPVNETKTTTPNMEEQHLQEKSYQTVFPEDKETLKSEHLRIHWNRNEVPLNRSSHWGHFGEMWYTVPDSLVDAQKYRESITLVGEKERKQLKEIVKKARTPLKTRIIPQEIVTKYRNKIAHLEKDITEIEGEENEERELRSTENQINKAKNMMENQLPQSKRTWFQSHRQRMEEQESLRLGDFCKEPNMKNGKRRKFVKGMGSEPEDRVNHEIEKSLEYASRFAKKSFKAKRIRAFSEFSNTDVGHSKLKKKQKKKTSFDKELTETDRKSVRQFRAGPSYKERKDLGLIGKKTNKVNKKRKKSR
ncbi:hypothetical protein ScPMuIL_000324 [Solemya velum]